MKKLSIFLTMFATIFLAHAVSGQSKYETYKNNFYKYSFSYPTDLLSPQGNEDKGAAPKFTGDQIEVDVFGTDMDFDSAELAEEFNGLVSSGAKSVVRKSLTKTSFEIFLNESGKIYRRKKMKLSNGKFVDIQIKYDESKRNVYDKVSDKIIKSVKAFK